MKRGRRRFGPTLGLAAALLVAYPAFWPVPIRPVAWQAPLPPPTEQYPQNGRLCDLERLADGVGIGRAWRSTRRAGSTPAARTAA